MEPAAFKGHHKSTPTSLLLLLLSPVSLSQHPPKWRISTGEGRNNTVESRSSLVSDRYRPPSLVRAARVPVLCTGCKHHIGDVLSLLDHIAFSFCRPATHILRICRHNDDAYFSFCLRTNSSIWFTGLKFCANTRNSHLLHLIWGAIYAICGVIQFVAGIYFMLELPIFHIGSNIWTGSWVNSKES